MMMVIPSLIIQPSFSRLASRTPSLLMICTLLPMRAFLSTMVLLTVEFAPANNQCQPVTQMLAPAHNSQGNVLHASPSCQGTTSDRPEPNFPLPERKRPPTVAWGTRPCTALAEADAVGEGAVYLGPWAGSWG